MITRQQVNNIITTALAHSTEDQVFAARLATALDALGLIQFCDISEPDEALGTRSSTDHSAVPLAHAEQRQQSQAEGAYERRDRTAENRAITGSSVNEYNEQRNRSADR